VIAIFQKKRIVFFVIGQLQLRLAKAKTQKEKRALKGGRMKKKKKNGGVCNTRTRTGGNKPQTTKANGEKRHDRERDGMHTCTARQEQEGKKEPSEKDGRAQEGQPKGGKRQGDTAMLGLFERGNENDALEGQNGMEERKRKKKNGRGG
jgi:hypothetical protein